MIILESACGTLWVDEIQRETCRGVLEDVSPSQKEVQERGALGVVDIRKGPRTVALTSVLGRDPN